MGRRTEQKISAKKHLYAIFGGLCVYCLCQTHLDSKRRYTSFYATFEHVIPLSLGGEMTLSRNNENLVLACQKCNNRRRSMSFIVWLQHHENRKRKNA